jgi:hypothetical protein
MRKLILITIVILTTLISCNRQQKQWRYEVKGFVTVDNKQYPAIWYTDTIEIYDTHLKYTNSDKSEVIIKKPYVLIDHKYDKK